MPHVLIAYPFDPVLGAVRPVYLSDCVLVTGPTDTPPRVCFRRRLVAPLALKRSLYRGAAIGGEASLELGSATFNNADGTLDDLAELDWGGRVVEIRYALTPRPRIGDFAPLLTTTAVRLTAGETLELELGAGADLWATPLGLSRFGGGGDAEGEAALAGRWRPVVLGRCRQIEPVLIHSGLNIYQVHDGPGTTITALRDRGVDLGAPGGDVADYAALAAAPMAGLTWRRAPAAGLLRTTTRPAGQLTADVDGAGGLTLSSILRWVLAQVPGLGLVADESALTALAVRCPQTVGYYHDGSSDLPVRDAIATLADSIGAWWGLGPSGLVTAARFEGPAVPDVVLNPRHVVRVTPRAVDHPAWRLTLGYRRYWTTLGDSDLAGAVASADRIDLGVDYRTVAAADQAVKAVSLLAQDERVNTVLDDPTAAAAEAARRLALWRRRWRAWEIELADDLPEVTVGRTVALTWPQHGLGAGRCLAVLEEARDRRARRLTITGLG